MDEFTLFLQRVGENIKRLRKIKELTQAALAEKTNRPQSSIARVETAAYEDASLSILYQLSNALGMSLSDLIAIAEGKKTSQKSQNTKKQKFETKWERTKTRVDRLNEAERDWIADLVDVALKNSAKKP